MLRKAGGKTALAALHKMIAAGSFAGRALALSVVAEVAGHHAVDTLGLVLDTGQPPERLAAVRLLGDLRYMKNGRQAATSAPTGLFCGGTQRTALVIRQSTSSTPSSGRAA